MTSNSALRGRIVLTFLFLSGATGLVYELVWSKYLANLLGNSGQAHAIVLGTFMGGLALGAYLFGRTADRTKNPLRLYGLLELGIGAYALVFRPVLDLLGSAYLAVAPWVPEGVRVFPKLALAASSLLVPTLLMGGTLPALARHFTQSMGMVQRELARLYAVNSLGAALGVFLAGVRLVPSLGLAKASALAAGLNLLLAVGAILLARAPRKVASPGASEEAGDEHVYPRAAVRVALVGVALSGFTAMLYQVTWIRLLTLVLGGSTYAFTLILTAFILGIGLGSFWLARRREQGDALRLFGKLQLGIALAVCLALPLYVRLPYAFWHAQFALNRTLETWPLYQLLTFFFACLVLLVPTFFMGAAFPCGARVATAKVSELGRQLGGVYLWNTVGTLSGSLLGGLLLLPLLGMEGNFALGLLLNVVGGALALGWAKERRKSSLWPVVATAAVGLLVVVAGRGWSPVVSNAGAFRTMGEAPPKSFARFQEELERDYEVSFYEDDTFATVLVGSVRGGQHRFMRINGKVDASNGADIETQVLAGHLGVLLHEREVKKVLLIGAGAAITAGSLLTHPIERLDLVEISPAVIEAARLFSEDNHHALEDPRLEVHIDDAKTFMALANERYDLIVSVPSNPWVVGVSGLFSRDFFQVAKRHLTEDGLIVQWIHTYESNEALVRLVMRTLRDTFPHATTWLGPQDLVMVAGKSPARFDVETVTERMRRAEVSSDLSRIRIPGVVTLLAKQVHSEEGQAAFAGQGPINTDDLNLLEYASPVAFFLRQQDVFVEDERRAPDGGRRLFLKAYLAQHPLTAAEAEQLYANFRQYHPVRDPLVRASAERWLTVAPESFEAAVAVAEAANHQGDLGRSMEVLPWDSAVATGAPRAMAVALDAQLRRARTQRSAWSELELEGAMKRALEVVQSEDAGPLTQVVKDGCGLVRAEVCGGLAQVLIP